MATSPTTAGTPASMALALVAAAAIGAAATTTFADLTAEVADLVDGNVQGGEWGFMLKRVDGPVLTAVNPDYLFYPASSMKVVQHVHAMKMIEEDEGIGLDTIVHVYTTSSDACDDKHSGQPYLEQTMEDTLRNMMENSQNADTNAIQEFFGRAAINATAHGIGGMSDATELNHKFGGYCGGPQPHQNQLPLSDAATLYERIAKGQVFDSPETRDTFYDLMLNWGYFFDLIDEERPEHMSDEVLDQFKSGVRECRKAGNWGDDIVSSLGWVKLPAPPCNDGTPREYTFGVFFDFVQSIEEGFTLQDVIYAMLRDEVRAILEEWQACTACGSGGACDEVHDAPGCDTGSCCESVCAVEPFCCTTSWEAGCVAQALDLCGLAQENDDCANAQSVQNGIGGIAFDNTGNDGPGHEGICGWDVEFMKDVWFSYTAIFDGHLEIQSLAGFETWVAVYETGECPVSENDLVACRHFLADAVEVVFETCAIGGETYLIRVGAANTEDGVGTLYVSNEVGFANDDYQDNPNGIGVANQIIADDFMLPCGNGGLDSLDIKVVDLDGGGPPSMLQWYLFESNAAGSGPGAQIANGIATNMQITPIDGGGSGAPDSFFDITFVLDAMPELLPGTTYWFGIQGPGVLPLQAQDVSGLPAHSFVLGSWQPAGGDFAFAIGPDDASGPCPADTNGDGTVDVADLVNVILDWGTATAPHNGDVTGDLTVDVADLVAVILSWGVCL